MIGYLMHFNQFFFIFLIIVFFQMFYFQLFRLNVKEPSSCLKTFKSNNLLGLIILISLVIGKVNF